MSDKRAFLSLQLEYLESPVAETRIASARRITYILQGEYDLSTT